MGQYFLGWFAAITVEAPDVWIDLNGFKLQQSREFNLKQRFFNVIQLSDRVFDNHEGVESLNFQKEDKRNFGNENNDFSSKKYGVPKVVSRCIISGGTLGLSSHNGVHANQGEDIVIEERGPEEVRGVQGRLIAPEGVGVWNPAFDVTPAALVSAWVTEHGIWRPPFQTE